jgi:hypothetical protein
MATRKSTTHVSRVRRTRSTRRGAQSRVPRKPAGGRDTHPDTITMLGKFADSRAVIETACKAMEADEHGSDVTTLRLGLRMLDGAYDFLDTTLARLR